MIVAPGEGRRLTTGSSRPTIKIGKHLGSRLLGLLESELPPGAGFPPHVHEEYEEVFYVLEGEIEYLIGEDWVAAHEGSTVFVPAGLAHGFRNPGENTCRHLAIASPAEAMTMIEELAGAETDQLASVMARYHTRLATAP
jgi:quercetin dioxygenase-like cupin family protein